MGDHRQTLREAAETEMFATTPATMAATQIAHTAEEMRDFWSDAPESIPASVQAPNFAAADFIEEIARAIFEDRLVILDAPREGRGVILTPRAETFRQQTERLVETTVKPGPGESRSGHPWPCPLFYVGNWTVEGTPTQRCTCEDEIEVSP